MGPKAQRPRRRELAWQSTETNQFGTNEFIDFCRQIDVAPMLAVNMGTGTIDQAAALVEYCNAPAGTQWSDLRVKHGYAKPHDVKYWCIGNEMDGPWQIGHLDMHDYGKKALEAGKMMRWQDPSIETVLCGSSNDKMPTFPEWDRVALETCWEVVDYHSIHMYVTNHIEHDTPSYLALSRRFEDFVDVMAATLRYVKAKNRSKHDVYLSWDEWQVWHPGPTRGNWTEAPHLAEVGYSLEDALVVAQWLNVFLRKCDVLKAACVAQIVNIISWMQTRNDGLLLHSSFYPFKLISSFARGNSLDALVRAPAVVSKEFGDSPALDVSASHDPETGAQMVSIVNRSLADTMTTDIVWQDGAPKTVREAWRLSGTDPDAANTWEKPNAVTAQKLKTPAMDGDTLRIKLPPLSHTVIVLSSP